MNRQNLIKRQLAQPANIELVCGLLNTNTFSHRSELAQYLCEQFGFYDIRGQKQQSGCLKALRELEAAGHFILPSARMSKSHSTPRRLPESVPLPVDLPLQVDEVNGLEIILVTNEAGMRIWNELMISDHPQGAGPLVGRQLRYLINSSYGWLGGFGFSSAALHLADRDEWIGWDLELRRRYLHYVIGMNRFLIRHEVNCRNLASKVMGMVMAALPDDFEQQFGYRPWLIESFVDTAHYSGICYRASNWFLVGKTKGRGRQDSSKQFGQSIKDIYVYPIDNDFRKKMDLSPKVGRGALAPGDGIESEYWAEHEFGGAPLSDARLSKRLVSVAEEKAKMPGRSFSGVVKGDWPKVKAYYRMIDQPEDSAVNMVNILAPHRKRTVQRMLGQKTVLCIQDGSDLTFTNLAKCKDLGDLKANQTGAKRRGLYLHSTLAVAPNGLPLGVVSAQCIAPEAKDPEDSRPPRAIPIEEKKTFVWIEHHRELVSLSTELPQTRLIHVCDREADFFEMFDEQRQNPRVDLLIRAHHNRNIPEEPFKLFAAVRQAPVQSRVRVHIPRQSARPKRSKQKARPKRPGRMADMEVHYMRIQLPPARYHAGKEPIDLWMVHALEVNPPEGAKAVEWFLLTTININSAADAEQCLRWYALRWRIEDWHRVLKSGCRILDLGHETAERLRRVIAINLVIAWRIMLMTLLGREVPELPADVLFSDIEIRTLQAYAKKKGLKPPDLLGEAVILVAKFGGYIGRKSDPPPGHQILWQGYMDFQYMCMGFALLDDG